MIPRFIQIFQTFTAQQLLTAQGLAFFLFRGDILAAISTIAIFAIVVYVETTRIEIPLAHSSVRGARGRFPVKLVYASVLPLILVRALQANIQMIGILLYNAGFTWVGTYTGNTDKRANVLSSANQRSTKLVPRANDKPGVASRTAVWHRHCRDGHRGRHICALFGVETTVMGPKAVAANTKLGNVHSWLPARS